MDVEPAISESHGNEPRPLFIVQELPNGVRFVATPTSKANGGPILTLFGAWLVSIAILTTTGVCSCLFIERTWGLVSLAWSMISLFYLLQLAWDAYAFSRPFFQINVLSRGKFVLELAGNRLQAGQRWGPPPPWFLGVAVPMILLPGLLLVTCVLLSRDYLVTTGRV
ncbi:MAG: hypothetical protein EXS09_13025 [Gemmataceae bacterium]|nr:hypothetical protein [Gemmataceae bacterium]